MLMPKARNDWKCLTCGAVFRTKRMLAQHRKDVGHSQSGCPQMVECVGCGVVLPKKECQRHRGSCQAAIVIANENRRAKAMKNLQEAYRWMREEGRAQNVATLKKASLMAASSESVRAVRAMNMVSRNKTQAAKEKSSKVARITSARPEIQRQRAARLAKWREDNPEALAESIKKAQRAAKPSKAEGWLEKNVLAKRGFKRNVRVRCGPHRKECDFVKEGFWVEVDGCWHFGKDFSQRRHSSEQVHERDVMLNREAERRCLVLVRLGLNCWRGHGHYILKDEWLELLNELLDDPVPGVYLFGECYVQGLWASDKCSTWRYVIDPTISSLQAD